MPLTLSEIEDIQADLMADDVEIDFEKMKLWDADQVTYYFENGGAEPPGEWTPPPCVPLTPVDDATFKKWFPKWKPPAATPKFRLVCFHNAGSAESNYTGKGLRMPNDNPFVVACNERGGELLAVELPGRESRRAEARYRTLSVAAEALFPVLAPKLNESVPYVVVGHSMGTWMLFETLKLLMARGVRLPEQVVVSSFPAPSLPAAKRPWRANKGMDDDAFKEECRTWSVNEVVFSAGMWTKGPNYEALMRDDFTLFDAYEYAPAVAPQLPMPVSAYYARDDKNVKESHVATWKDMTCKDFRLEEVPGNHLFFYQYDVRNKWMDRVVESLPDGFM